MLAFIASQYDICSALSPAMLFASSSSDRIRFVAVPALPLVAAPDVAEPPAMVAPLLLLLLLPLLLVDGTMRLDGFTPVPRNDRRTPSEMSDGTSFGGFVSAISFRRLDDMPEIYASENGACGFWSKHCISQLIRSSRERVCREFLPVAVVAQDRV